MSTSDDSDGDWLERPPEGAPLDAAFEAAAAERAERKRANEAARRDRLREEKRRRLAEEGVRRRQDPEFDRKCRERDEREKQERCARRRESTRKRVEAEKKRAADRYSSVSELLPEVGVILFRGTLNSLFRYENAIGQPNEPPPPPRPIFRSSDQFHSRINHQHLRLWVTLLSVNGACRGAIRAAYREAEEKFRAYAEYDRQIRNLRIERLSRGRTHPPSEGDIREKVGIPYRLPHFMHKLIDLSFRFNTAISLDENFRVPPAFHDGDFANSYYTTSCNRTTCRDLHIRYSPIAMLVIILDNQCAVCGIRTTCDVVWGTYARRICRACRGHCFVEASTVARRFGVDRITDLQEFRNRAFPVFPIPQSRSSPSDTLYIDPAAILLKPARTTIWVKLSEFVRAINESRGEGTAEAMAARATDGRAMARTIINYARAHVVRKLWLKVYADVLNHKQHCETFEAKLAQFRALGRGVAPTTDPNRYATRSVPSGWIPGVSGVKELYTLQQYMVHGNWRAYVGGKSAREAAVKDEERGAFGLAVVAQRVARG
jgi:hypothetical protein